MKTLNINPLEYVREKYQYSEIKEFLENELGIGFDDISVYVRTEDGHFRAIQKRNDEVAITVNPDGNCEITYPL
jgi:hypothetical protein